MHEHIIKITNDTDNLLKYAVNLKFHFLNEAIKYTVWQLIEEMMLGIREERQRKPAMREPSIPDRMSTT